MANILMWIGIAVIVIGWLALAWQASRRLAAKEDMGKYPQKRKTMQLHRNYCLLTIAAGMVILISALII